jgi:hypothetical protein
VEKSCPYLFEMFGGKKIPTHVLNVIFGELIALLGKSDKSIDFVYGNGECGHAIIVSHAKSQFSFMEYARKFKWEESGKESLGYPLVQRMTESAVEAEWADANINVTQQWILKKHLHYQFGKVIFIAENKRSADCNYCSVPMHYREYKYFKDGDKSKKAEKCSYWSRDASLVVKKELEWLIDYTDFNVVNQKFSSLTTSGCTLITGANQGQGAWYSWIKISTMSSAEIRNSMDIDADFDPRSVT